MPSAKTLWFSFDWMVEHHQHFTDISMSGHWQLSPPPRFLPIFLLPPSWEGAGKTYWTEQIPCSHREHGDITHESCKNFLLCFWNDKSRPYHGNELSAMFPWKPHPSTKCTQFPYIRLATVYLQINFPASRPRRWGAKVNVVIVDKDMCYSMCHIFKTRCWRRTET